jgi:hypothetical protein
LKALRTDIPDDVLVAAGHNLPFYGLHTRAAELLRHHQARCDLVLQACRAAPKSAAELIPSVFSRKLDPHQTGFAFSEVLAHMNNMLRQGTFEPVATGDRIQRVGAASQLPMRHQTRTIKAMRRLDHADVAIFAVPPAGRAISIQYVRESDFCWRQLQNSARSNNFPNGDRSQ